ncbi:DNA cytosine methyltransferase [Stackebrandtia nassauensis]|nr:DNA cytosine methyltransferase [Stackebrandtia nassauensis]
MDWFCGAGGSSQGIDAVPGVEVTLAANHWQLALDSHAANFPHVDHKIGDIRKLPVQDWPIADGFWASPECKKFSSAQGVPQIWASDAPTLPGMEPETDEAAERSRALMWDVPKYLAGARRRGKPVRFGVVENVVEIARSPQWKPWKAAMRGEGYDLAVIAFNSMHAQGTESEACCQSRNRAYIPYWDASLGRAPDFDKWLRPRAWCPSCDEVVNAMQVFKKPGVELGLYGPQYVYRCPKTSCRGQQVEPTVLPAAAAIDWNIETPRIGDRPKTERKPEGLKPATIARIRAGIDRHWAPLLVPSGGTWRKNATRLADPMPARTTTDNDAIALPELVVPLEARAGNRIAPADEPIRTQTGRRETGLVLPPVMVTMRGGGSRTASTLPEADPMAAVSAGGNHHRLVQPPLLVPYYSNGTTRTIHDPIGALSTRDRYALVMRCINNRGTGAAMSTPVTEPARTFTATGRQALLTGGPILDIDEVRFRMLEPHEVAAAMAFRDDYIVLGSKRNKVRQYGNAVTPPVAELLISALVEAVTGDDLDRHNLTEAA